MSVDNRTILNDCESATGWTGDDAVTVTTLTGSFYEGSSSLSTQLSNADEHMYTTEDSVGTGTFSLDLSDSTVYMLLKDNLGDTAANGGVQIVLGSGLHRAGYDVGGNDAPGLLLPNYFQTYKLDVSVIVATPGSFATYAGLEATIDHTAITQIGYGALHLAKANGPSDNAFMDCFRYIANDSYALTINGGTSGTPETMADVRDDDVTNGWGMVGNPIGSMFWFIAPTEWGESAANADHYFTASNEQWYWLGGNGGGHLVGAGHFIFRVVGNATDTGSFVLDSVSIVNTGTGANFDCSSANIDTLEIDGCTMIGLATFVGPVSGGTSRFVTNTSFQGCGLITHNGASMNGSEIRRSTVAANASSMFYNTNADPNGEMDDMTFVKGTAAHHAIEFGSTAPLSMTLTGWTTSGFNALDDENDSTFFFADRGSDSDWVITLVNPSGNFSYRTARSGDTVRIIVSPVDTVVHVDDETGADLAGARVYLQAADATGPLPYQESVTIVRATTLATVTHTGAHGMETGDLVLIRGITDKVEDNRGTHEITVLSPTTYSYVTTNSGSLIYSGAIVATWVAFNEDTDVNGDVTLVKSYPSDQPVIGRVRKSTTSPRYKSFPISGTISNTAGLAVNVRMILDE